MNKQSAWFKSSYSDSEGSECLEVALSWRKSSHSDSEGSNCVEVAECPETVHVRDSKRLAGPRLAFPARAWSRFLVDLTT
ncbi:DUF397 domain-containing protein [Streptomyces sp. 549]|uniref:DUF397 domain-containing protein n=1 Tax=Streptomyces sp. 549 TaxID=3049076 RepID=UPI0024C31289|nr:DUF397 domain-containing protein [Streptomyces sp. 549]MDK1472480.1 DUF397 domain-containing protein [Streptomyces sp. 549]